MVVFGIVEFGRAMMVSQLVTNAAREGARLAIVDGNTNADVEARIKEFLHNSINVGGTDVTVAITITPAVGNNDPLNVVKDSQSGDLVAVRVNVPFEKVSYAAGKYLQGKNLVGQAAMRHE
jgi:Flp pilus assembly protein TadG